jgi:hypothetical protein
LAADQTCQVKRVNQKAQQSIGQLTKKGLAQMAMMVYIYGGQSNCQIRGPASYFTLMLQALLRIEGKKG